MGRKMGPIKVDSPGRIYLPVEIRSDLGFQVGDEVDLEVFGRTLVVTKHQPVCVSCGQGIATGVLLCKSCSDALYRHYNGGVDS